MSNTQPSTINININTATSSQTAVFGGGCFWCTEAVFRRLRGVESVVSGYAGGQTPTPSYEQVSSGNTGHAEVIKITFDPTQVSYQQLLTVFFAVHDPSTLNQQGADVGTQYRSVILSTTSEQQQQATDYIASLQQAGQTVVTTVEPLQTFYSAEEYHQQFYDRNPSQMYCSIVINPKLEKLFSQFPDLVADSSRA